MIEPLPAQSLSRIRMESKIRAGSSRGTNVSIIPRVLSPNPEVKTLSRNPRGRRSTVAFVLWVTAVTRSPLQTAQRIVCGSDGFKSVPDLA